MKTLILTLILGVAAAGGAVAFSVLYEQPAKASADAGIDPSRMMRNAKDLPAADYADYSVVFN